MKSFARCLYDLKHSRLALATAVSLCIGPMLMPPAFAGPYELGLRMYEQGNYQMAAQYFTTATSQDTSNPNAHYYLADSYLKLNRLSEAQLEYEKILALAPDSQAARMSRIGLAKLRSFLDATGRTPIQGTVGSGSHGGVDSYQGPVGSDNYLDDVTENGKVVRWALTRMPLKLFIERSPQGIRNFQPAFINEIRRGLDIWTNVLGHQLDYVLVDNPEAADIRVNWTNTIDTRGHNTDGGTSYTAGLTLPHIKNDELDYMDVKIATFDIEGKPQNTDIVYAVAIHELGHALGLLGHSQNAADIMFAQNQHVTKPSQRDINTIRKLYMASADINNLTPSTHPHDAKHDEELATKMDAAIKKNEERAKQTDMALSWLNLGVSYFQKAKLLTSSGKPVDPQKPETDPRTWYNKALDATGKAIQREPMDPRAYHKRSLVYQELNDYNKALADIQMALKLDRSEPEYYMLDSWYLAKLGETSQARGALDTYLLLKPSAAQSSEVRDIVTELAKQK